MRLGTAIVARLICAGVLLAAPTSATVAQGVICEIIDVIDMYDEGLSRGEIRDECGGEVDAGTCTLTKVMRFARDGYDEVEIMEECGGNLGGYPSGNGDYGTAPTLARFCVTPYGTCPLNLGAAQVGGACFCTSAFGTAYGFAQ